MTYHYLNPADEKDPYRLPNVEVFWVDEGEWFWDENGNRTDDRSDEEGIPYSSCDKGYYYWFCFPGCMPDSNPYGPFETEEEAIENCRNFHGD